MVSRRARKPHSRFIAWYNVKDMDIKLTGVLDEEGDTFFSGVSEIGDKEEFRLGEPLEEFIDFSKILKEDGQLNIEFKLSTVAVQDAQNYYDELQDN